MQRRRAKRRGAAFEALWSRFVTTALSRRQDGLPQLTATVVGLHKHFAGHDYKVSFGDTRVWHSFVSASVAAWKTENRTPEPSLAELTEAFRLAYRFLIVLDAEVPVTDVAHSAAAGLCGLPCIVAKVTRGTPYLLTEHGIYLREQYLNLRRTTPSAFVRWFASRLIGAVTDLNYMHADLIAPVCDYNTRWEKWRGVASDRISVIYNGVDPERFPPCPPAKNARPTVVAVSQIFTLKGQLDLIEAAAHVRSEIPDVEFRIYGAITDQSYYEQCVSRVAELDLASTVTFCGSTDRPLGRVPSRRRGCAGQHLRRISVCRHRSDALPAGGRRDRRRRRQRGARRYGRARARAKPVASRVGQ